MGVPEGVADCGTRGVEGDAEPQGGLQHITDDARVDVGEQEGYEKEEKMRMACIIL